MGGITSNFGSTYDSHIFNRTGVFLDNPDALRGLYLDGVVLDEYADMKPKIWGEVIRPLLADRQGWATFIGTPKGHNTFYDIYQYATINKNEWYSSVLRASQTQLILQAELDDALKSMSVDQYQQEFECSFEAAILGAIYGTEMRLLTDAGRAMLLSLPV